RDAIVAEKTATIRDLEERLAQATSEQHVTAAIERLSEVFRVHREDTVRSLAQLTAGQDNTLEGLGGEIRVLAQSLSQLAGQHGAAANGTTETLQRLSAEVRDQRNETVRSLTVVQQAFRDRDGLIEGKDREIHALAGQL